METFDGQSTATEANGVLTLADPATTRNYRYDNRLLKTTLPNSATKTTAWRPDGGKQSDTDEAGHTTTYGYDPVGWLTQVTQTQAGTDQQTTYTYDELGNKTSQTDAAGNLTAHVAFNGQKTQHAYRTTAEP